MLDEVIVEGDREAVLPGGYVKTLGNVGLLDSQHIMDEPFSQVNLSQKTIDTFGGPNQPLSSILVNAPAVRVEGTTLHNDISIRGLNSTGTAFYLNGIPGLMTQFNSPTFPISDIQVISGPNSGITGIPSTYETTTAGGIVNFVSKKAEDQPITRFKETFSGKSSFGEYLDIGRRFGENKEWGFRVNTEWLDGETAIDNHDIKSNGIYLNLDHKDEKSKTNLLAGYRNIDIRRGQRWFALGSNVTKMLSAPDASKDYGFDGQRKAAEGYIIALNHEQQMNDTWGWFANIGVNHNKLRYNTGAQSSSVTIINNEGDVSKKIFSTQTVTDNQYAQFGFKGEFRTGQAEHTLHLAGEKAWYTIESAKSNFAGKMGTITGNIYTGLIVNDFYQPIVETGVSSKKQYWGVSIADQIKWGKSEFLIGVHKHEATVDSYSAATGKHNSSVTSDAVCPTYGYVYRPNDKISFYASHSENFDGGTIVPNSSNGIDYENGGDILDPAKTKQNEVGIKYLHNGLLLNVSYFDIKQANNIDVLRSDGMYLLQDGEQRHKGVEFSINGKLADKWNFMGGFLYVNAEQARTKDGINDGKMVNGKSRWSGVAALEYEANEEFSAVLRMLYNGSAKINNEALTVPSYVTWDLGVNYKTRIGKTPVTFSAMCYNLTDKNYWNAHGNGLLLSSPRTFALSASIDF